MNVVFSKLDEVNGNSQKGLANLQEITCNTGFFYVLSLKEGEVKDC